MRRDPIVIVEYDDAWPTMFEAERARLAAVFAPALVRPIEHIGSTAVPGLAAKAIIDMLAVVGDIESARRCVNGIASIGWVSAPEPSDDAQRRLSLCTPSIEHRTHHLHVVEERFDGWRGWLAFRDRLRADPGAAAEYAALKRDLADRHGADPDERDAYRAGKADFIVEVTTAAQREG
jgi:GrpB-like predicted nucleotidyltransferase (UPF0157 family)